VAPDEKSENLSQSYLVAPDEKSENSSQSYFVAPDEKSEKSSQQKLLFHSPLLSRTAGSGGALWVQRYTLTCGLGRICAYVDRPHCVRVHHRK